MFKQYRFLFAALYCLCFGPVLAQDIAHVGQPYGPVIDAYLFRPKTAPPYPTVLALHGCGGLKNTQGDFYLSYQDWTNRFTDLG